MGRSRHCTEEKRTLIKKWIGEGKTYKEVEKINGCSAKMIFNALKCQRKPEKRGRKRNTTIRVDRKITRMAKGMKPGTKKTENNDEKKQKSKKKKEKKKERRIQ